MNEYVNYMNRFNLDQLMALLNDPSFPLYRAYSESMKGIQQSIRVESTWQYTELARADHVHYRPTENIYISQYIRPLVRKREEYTLTIL